MQLCLIGPWPGSARSPPAPEGCPGRPAPYGMSAKTDSQKALTFKLFPQSIRLSTGNMVQSALGKKWAKENQVRNKINIVGSIEFDSFAAADKFCESKDASFEHVSMLSNTPWPGRYLVKWGYVVEMTAEQAWVEDMRVTGDMIEKREQDARNEFEERCRQEGRKVAAEKAARAAGYVGRDAEVFAAGFRGVPAIQQNSRAEGREPIFRAGRMAWGSNEGQRACRVASVRARSVVQQVLPAPLDLGAGLLSNNEF